jgi:hypothetical protein
MNTNITKSLLSIFFVFLGIPASAIAQESDTTECWHPGDMVYLREHNADFVDKKMSSLFCFLQQKGMGIASASSWDSSPYEDPCRKGRSYIRKLYLWSKDRENLKKGDIYQELVVTLDLEENDTTLRSPTFWRSFDPDKFEVEQFVQKTKDLPIRSIEIRTDTIIGRKM